MKIIKSLPTALCCVALATATPGLRGETVTMTVTQLQVESPTGEVSSYELSENSTVKFVDDSVTISLADAKTVSLPLSKVANISYAQVEKEVTGVESLPADRDYKVSGQAVLTLREGDNSLRVVDVNGVELVNKTLRGNGERVYPLMGLKPGTYVVSFNGETLKMVKR